MMEHTRRFEDTAMGRFVKMWPVSIAMVTLIFAVGTTTSTINQIEKTLDQNEIRDEVQERRIAVVEEGNRNITERLNRMEDKLDRILKAVR